MQIRRVGKSDWEPWLRWYLSSALLCLPPSPNPKQYDQDPWLAEKASRCQQPSRGVWNHWNLSRPLTKAAWRMSSTIRWNNIGDRVQPFALNFKFLRNFTTMQLITFCVVIPGLLKKFADYFFKLRILGNFGLQKLLGDLRFEIGTNHLQAAVLVGLSPQGYLFQPRRVHSNFVWNWLKKIRRRSKCFRKCTVIGRWKRAKLSYHTRGFGKVGNLSMAMTGRDARRHSVQKVCQVLGKDRRLSIQLIEHECGIPKTMVHRILTDDIQMRKVCAKIIPKVLTSEIKVQKFHECCETDQNFWTEW